MVPRVLPQRASEARTLVPRPRMDHTGKIIPESDLRKLWVIRRSVGIRDEWYPDGRAYLTRDGRWGPLDVAAAWEVVEKIRREWFIRISTAELLSAKWRAVMWAHLSTTVGSSADGDTAPLAICRAALKAVGA